MDLDPTKSGKISSGHYRKPVNATIDPLWPSSFKYDVGGDKLGWIRYRFEAKFMSAVGKMGSHAILEKSFDFWVLNSLDPSPAPPLSTKLLYQKMVTKKSGLNMSISIPSEGRVEIGQVVPVTLEVPPFEKSKYSGQAAILTDCVFKLRQLVVGRTNVVAGWDFKTHKDLLTVALKTDEWPKDGKNGLNRVIHLSLPSYPEMGSTAKTPWMDVAYVLELSIKIRAEGQKEKDAEVLKAQCKKLERYIHFFNSLHTFKMAHSTLT